MVSEGGQLLLLGTDLGTVGGWHTRPLFSRRGIAPFDASLHREQRRSVLILSVSESPKHPLGKNYMTSSLHQVRGGGVKKQTNTRVLS